MPEITTLQKPSQEENSVKSEIPGLWERLVKAVGKTKLTEIADFFEVPVSTASEWKNNKRIPPLRHLIKVAEERRVSLDWLIRGINPETEDPGLSLALVSKKPSSVNPPPSQDFGDQMTVLLEYTMGQKVRELAANEGITPEEQVALFVWEALKDRRMIRTRPDSGEILQYLNLGERQVSWVKVRMRGYIAAGKPIQFLDSDDEQWVEIPDIMVRNRDVYALTAKGDSMIGEGVFDGDVVVVDPHGTVINGTTVVAIIDGEAATLKKFYKNGSFATLVSANPAYDPIPVHLSKLELKGVMVGVLRGRGKSF